MKDTDLEKHVVDILKNSDLDTITLKLVRKTLESKLNVSLKHKKDFIRDITTSWLERGRDATTNNGGDGDEISPTKKRSCGRNKSKIKTEKIERKKGGGGFTAEVQLSVELQEFFSRQTMPRTQVVKELWVYIKANNFQDPSDRREILCDDKLKKIFKRDQVNMMKMNKYLSEQMKRLDQIVGYDDNGDPLAPTSKKKKVVKKIVKKRSNKKQDSDEIGTKRKRSSGGGFTAPVQLSVELQEFFSRQTMPRTQVVKELWVYIKANNLQDPSDRREILCDDKLKKIFKRDQVNMMKMNKYLSEQMTKIDKETSTEEPHKKLKTSK